jgi:hypothetical protein
MEFQRQARDFAAAIKAVGEPRAEEAPNYTITKWASRLETRMARRPRAACADELPI